mmetsp:Transcript_19839/g.31771  ORF Transcript_19839/g.31771 Transcript_19839/m.31771 type:complete len:222 (-) Transcript_19839:421-1086(-)
MSTSATSSAFNALTSSVNVDTCACASSRAALASRTSTNKRRFSSPRSAPIPASTPSLCCNSRHSLSNCPTTDSRVSARVPLPPCTTESISMRRASACCRICVHSLVSWATRNSAASCLDLKVGRSFAKTCSDRRSATFSSASLWEATCAATSRRRLATHSDDAMARFAIAFFVAARASIDLVTTSCAAAKAAAATRCFSNCTAALAESWQFTACNSAFTLQ